jgi:glycosyltransferase involved in cell wall biosynthesis
MIPILLSLSEEGEALRILHLISQVPAATGSGIYLQAALRHARRAGHENFLLAGVSEEFAGSQWHDSLACQGHRFVYFGRDLPHAVVGMSDVMPYASCRFCDLSAAELQRYEACFADCLQRVVRQWRPDLIHAQHLWLVTALACRLFPQLPIVASCHGTDLRQLQLCPHLADRVIAGCRGLRRVYALHPDQQLEIAGRYDIAAERIELVGSGYNEQLFYLPDQPRPAGPLQLVYAGKLSRAKGVPWLLRALLGLPQGDWQLHLAGDGQGGEKEEILQLVAQRPQQLCWHGAIRQAQLAQLLRSSHLCLLPSLYEGLPLILLEALACGCHVLTTELPGTRALFAGVTDERIERIHLPLLEGVDRPAAAAEDNFIAALQAGLQRQLQLLRAADAAARPQLSAEISGVLQRYRWETTFRRMEQGYWAALAEPPAASFCGHAGGGGE